MGVNFISGINPTVVYRNVDGIIAGSHPLHAAHPKVAKEKPVLQQENKPAFQSFINWVGKVGASAVILSILLFIIVNFYIFASLVNFNKFFYIFLILSLLTDGLFILIHLFRRETDHREISFEPHKVTIVIACYNGEDVIRNTIKNCLRHVPAHQIIVVSDASTDKTAEIAESLDVKVVKNRVNLHKALSVHEGVKLVKTPYVLLLDDDVLIGKAVIPTSLLDEGYTAVAFNVMPIASDTVVNNIQRFEYRNSMHIGKSLRGSVGAVGNVLGAIGLYRTKDLLEQQDLHSGQFAGEDEQRTILSHMYGTGKGVTYTGDTVLTLVPPTFYALYRQRAYSWSLAVPELFTLYWRIILSPRYHFLFKAEKAYYLYIYLTDPLRLLFLWALILRPAQLLMTYMLYLTLNTLVWAKTKRRDHYFVVLLYPFYTLWLSICRFIGNFYWLRVKARYLRKGLYKKIEGRRLLAEYSLVMLVFFASWGISGLHFMDDMRVFNKIRGYRLEEPTKPFAYDVTNANAITDMKLLSNMKLLAEAPAPGTYLTVPLEKGDTSRAIAYKAVEKLLAGRPDIKLSYQGRMRVNELITQSLVSDGVYVNSSSSVLIVTSIVEQSVQKAGDAT